MSSPAPAVSQQAAVEAALVLLERMGLSPADLVAAPASRPAVPTFAEYVPVVSATVSAGTRRAYGSYWNRIVEHWGTRRLDEPTPSDIRQLMTWVKTHVVARRNARGGRSAQEHLVAALRCLYRQAERDGLIAEADNPARKVDKPRRLPSTRRAVADTRLTEINQVASTTGNDPELDTLLLRLHTETACRRGGALALRPQDLDPDQCLILLREKGETVRWQPVSPTLMTRLVQHGQDRHAPADGQLLRYADGHPITSRRYDHLWTRIGRHLPWVRTQQISMHWIRHTTLTWVVSATSASPSPSPTPATRTTGKDHAPWAPWPPTSGPDCPRWRPPSPPSPENPTRWPSKTPAQAPPANTGIDPGSPCSQNRPGLHPHPARRPPWCYRHDSLVRDRRSTATPICEGAARSCFRTQASLSRSVIGAAGPPDGGSKQIVDYSRPPRRSADCGGGIHIVRFWAACPQRSSLRGDAANSAGSPGWRRSAPGA
jgi:site-specific recombinase XerD